VKQQKAWALVTGYGYVSLRTMRSTRKEVIAYVLKDYYGLHERRYSDLTTTQFWRKMKHKYGWTVRRVGLRVLS